MFWQNLYTIKHAVEEMLNMDKASIDDILANGHGWVLDKIATSKDDIEESYHLIEGPASSTLPSNKITTNINEYTAKLFISFSSRTLDPLEIIIIGIKTAAA